MSNTNYLRRRRGGGWAAVVYVPTSLQQKLKGKKEIVRGLGTRNLKEANELKWAVLAEIQQYIAKLQNPKAELMAEATRIAEDFDPDNEPLEDGISEAAHRIESRYGEDFAVDYYKTATRQRLPVSIALQMWMKEADGITEGTKVKYKGHVEAFIEWSNDADVNKVDRRMAGAYVTHVKTTPNWRTAKLPSHQTVVHSIRAVGRLWKWLDRRGYLKEDKRNPWSEQVGAAPGEKKVKRQKELRAITKAEAQQWLSATKEQAQEDLILLAWHTGIRANDLAELTVDRVNYSDEQVYWLTIIAGKSEANTRALPVVSNEASEVLRQRVAGAVDGILFHDLKPGGPDSKRYWHIQKRINRLRKKALGTAPVDFHSFRRAFSVACEEADLDPVKWSRMMGHNAPTLAASVYNRGHHGRRRLLEGMRLVDVELGELT